MFPSFENYKPQLQETKGINTSLEFCNTLLKETGVALLPGSSFSRESSELSARLAFVNFDGGKALKAPEVHSGPVTSEFVEKYCDDTVTGIHKLCSWLQKL